MSLDSYYAKRTTRILELRTHAAYVLEGTYQGHFVALTVRVKGSRWAWHPMRPQSASFWTEDRRDHGTYDFPNQPPRHIRKAAKMALRRWLSPI